MKLLTAVVVLYSKWIHYHKFVEYGEFNRATVVCVVINNSNRHHSGKNVVAEF